MFLRVIPEPEIDEFRFLIFLSIKLSLAFTKVSLFNFLASIFFDSFAIELTNGISLLVISNTSSKINSLGGLNINPPDRKILENRVFENFILADKPLGKFLKLVY